MVNIAFGERITMARAVLNMLNTILKNYIDKEHTFEKVLDKAWGLEPDSRLGCRAIVQDEDLVVEIPKYTVNMVSEGH
jgi:hypothetical protein